MSAANPALAAAPDRLVDTFAGALRAQAGDASLRRAALMLHALAPADRDWLLAELPVARRTPLAQLLDELVQLGIPASAALAGRSEHALDSSPAQRLAQCTPPELLAVLEREPAMLTARLFGWGDWPWKAAVLAGLSPGRRRQVQAALAGDGAPRRRATALDAELMSLLDERVAAARARAGRRPAWQHRLRTVTHAGLPAFARKMLSR